MDISNVRKQRLISLIDDLFDGRQIDFCIETDLSPAQVSQWLTGYRKIGEKAARRIESKLKLDQLWMDEQSVSFRPDVLALAKELQALSPDQVAKIRALVLAFEPAVNDEHVSAPLKNDHRHLKAAQTKSEYETHGRGKK